MAIEDFSRRLVKSDLNYVDSRESSARLSGFPGNTLSQTLVVPVLLLQLTDAAAAAAASLLLMLRPLLLLVSSNRTCFNGKHITRSTEVLAPTICACTIQVHGY